MAKILMEDGHDPLERTIGGSTYYVLGGRPMLRQRVTPIQPRSAAQRREVNAITDASRAWAWRLSPTQKFLYGFPCFWGWKGSPWFQAIWSILNWIWEEWGPFDWAGSCPDPICCDGLVIDAVAGTMMVSIAPGGTGGMLGYVSASPPMSPGRVPTLADTRSLAVGVTAGTTIDVGPAYIARFGRLPTSGLVGIAMRFGDLALGSCTPICFSTWPHPVPEEILVTLSNSSITLTPFSGAVEVDAFWGEPSGPTITCSWSVVGMTLATAPTPPPTTLGALAAWFFTQVAAVDASETVQIRATSDQTGAFGQAPLLITSSSM